MSRKDYIPTPAERRRFRVLLRERTPTAAIYEQYRHKARLWLARANQVTQTINILGRRVQVARARMRASELFRRVYLVANVNGEWLLNTDASVVSAGSWPPIVLLPLARVRSRKLTLRSLLEHEFVHVNQMLLGIGARGGATTLDEWLRDFFQSASAEYEANFLQLVRWPRLYSPDNGLSLDHWCALRGYTASLESVIATIARGAIPHRVGIRLLRTIPDVLVEGFADVGIEREHAKWFRQRWNDHLAVALGNVGKEEPQLLGMPGFHAVCVLAQSAAKAKPLQTGSRSRTAGKDGA
jgi:hypothetical protein